MSSEYAPDKNPFQKTVKEKLNMVKQPLRWLIIYNLSLLSPLKTSKNQKLFYLSWGEIMKWNGEEMNQIYLFDNNTLPLDTILSRFGAMITAFNFFTFRCFNTSRKPNTYLRFCLNYTERSNQGMTRMKIWKKVTTITF